MSPRGRVPARRARGVDGCLKTGPDAGFQVDFSCLNGPVIEDCVEFGGFTSAHRQAQLTPSAKVGVRRAAECEKVAGAGRAL